MFMTCWNFHSSLSINRKNIYDLNYLTYRLQSWYCRKIGSSCIPKKKKKKVEGKLTISFRCLKIKVMAQRNTDADTTIKSFGVQPCVTFGLLYYSKKWLLFLLVPKKDIPLFTNILLYTKCSNTHPENLFFFGKQSGPVFIAHRWLSWLSIGLSCGRSWVRLRPDQHSGS